MGTQTYGPQTEAVEALLEQVKTITPGQLDRFAAAKRAVRDEVWDAASDATLALVARDLITEEYFDILYGPWKSVMEVKQ